MDLDGVIDDGIDEREKRIRLDAGGLGASGLNVNTSCYQRNKGFRHVGLLYKDRDSWSTSSEKGL